MPYEPRRDDPIPRPHDAGPADGPAYEEIPTLDVTPVSSLQVHIDVIEALAHFDGDEAKTFEFLGKLKDLLA